MKVFGISNFDRDYEDTWEWIEGRNEERVHVNVSRPHNWKTGDYEVPIVINVLFPAAIITEDLFLEKAQCLANKLKTNVWIGSVVRKDPNDAKYDFMIDREFAPQQ